MATSPAPDAAAPPGMCPGIAVLGGGGGSGDGSGDGSGNGNGNGGNGNGNGEDGNGNGKGAGNCGQGGTGACTNCHHNVSAGDPVDVVSGEVFTLPIRDLALPGPIDLHFEHKYRGSQRAVDVGLGYGWCHTFAWRLSVRKKAVVVRQGTGAVVEFDRPLVIGQEMLDVGGWILRKEGAGYVVDTNDDFLHVFTPIDEKGIEHRLSSVRHTNGNSFELRYAPDGALVEMLDSARRVIRFETGKDLRISSISIRDPETGYTITFARFEYDARGDLVSHTDGDDAWTRYEYDDEHRLVRYRYPSGLTFHFVYDRQGRCTETWGDLPGSSFKCLAPDLPEFLDDKVTRVKGVYHVKIDFDNNGYSEVSTTRNTLRFFANERGDIDKAVGGGGVTTREFDDRGRVVSHTSPAGAVTRYEWDRRGRLTKQIDPLSRAYEIVRDEHGWPVQAIDLDGTMTECFYDSRGNKETVIDAKGNVTSYKYDDRSLLTEMIEPNGARTTFKSDAMGNCVEMVTPDGAVWRWTWDYFGRPIQRIDPRGNVQRYTYSDMGKTLSVSYAEGSSVRVEWDDMGCYTAISDDAGTIRFEWDALRWMHRRVHADGTAFEYRYNHEGWCVQIVNERGEIAEFQHDHRGLTQKVKYFDDRVMRYRWDSNLRMVGYTNPARESTELVRDLIGRIVEIAYHDDSKETVEYDARDRIVATTSSNGTVVLREYDENGFLAAEIQKLGDEHSTVMYQNDATNRVVQISTSDGYSQRYQRDAMGLRQRVDLGDGSVVGFERNALGLVTRQHLPRGGVIENEWDARYRLTRRRVLSPSMAVPKVGRNEPEWIGVTQGPAVIDKAFRYTPTDDIIAIWDSARGLTSYQYDLRQRLLTRAPENEENEAHEAFRYDKSGNMSEASSPRVYGAGGKLLETGTARYIWDDAGRLAEKRVGVPDASGEQVWKYTWNGQELLSSVTCPDGTRVEFLYDPYFRRVSKTVSKWLPQGKMQEVQRTRYVWDKGRMIHESTRTTDESYERLYCYDEYSRQPWAHQDVKGADGERKKSDWFFYVGDVIDTPEDLVASDGSVACRLQRLAWGQTRVAPGAKTATPIRFHGQYEDVETGLAYNYFRYYEPEAGQYISPDPIGFNSTLR